MPVYQVKAKKADGRTTKMRITAPGRAEAAQMVQRQGAIPVSIWEDESAGKSGGGSTVGKASGLNISLLGPKAATSADVTIFCRMLAISIAAGLPLRDALESISDEMDENTLKVSLLGVTNDLQSGKRFADSIRTNNKGRLFSPVFIGLIHVAEESGTLRETLNDLADYLEASARLKREIKSKMSYPIFMLIAFVLTNLAATFFLFPMFRKNFESLGNDLPALTLFVFDLNSKVLDLAPYWISIIVLVVGSIIGFYLTPAGRLSMDRFFLKLPALGPVFFKVGTARFAKTLAITARGGVSLTEGIEIGAAVVSNMHLQKSLFNAKDKILNGESFTNSLKDTGAFSGLVVRMIGVGEESGSLPMVLDKISEIFSNEVDAVVGKAVQMIEPMIIVLFGVFVTVMVLALYMPIFSMAG